MRVAKYFSILLAMPLLMASAQGDNTNVKTSVSPAAVVSPAFKGNPSLNSYQTKTEKARQNETKVKKADYSKVTDNPKIMQALDSMIGTTGEWSRKAILGDNLSKRPIKVSFKNLAEISPQYSDFDALGWKDAKGQLYIYINQKHSNTPAEALGCLLSHEAVHQDGYSSIEEETYCWGYEADVWIQMKKRNPELKSINSSEYPLVYRLNTIEVMFKNGNYTTKEIRKSVASNPGYAGLPVTSPGFEKSSN